jgi:anti-anti-sigma factor
VSEFRRWRNHNLAGCAQDHHHFLFCAPGGADSACAPVQNAERADSRPRPTRSRDSLHRAQAWMTSIFAQLSSRQLCGGDRQLMESPVKDNHTGKVSGDRLSIMRARPHRVATDTAVVQLNGEIDGSNAGQVSGLADAFAAATVIICDMSGVSFLGAAGLTALLRLAAQLSLTGRHLVLTGTDHHPVRRPIAICGLDSILDCRPTLGMRSEKSSTWFAETD